jgi:hypothetical protein
MQNIAINVVSSIRMRSFKMQSVDARSLLILMLTGTICLVILIIVILWAIVGPERVPQTARDHLHELIILIIGIISGYLAGHGRQNGKVEKGG